jgi:tyrosyl-tRNA synthetase
LPTTELSRQAIEEGLTVADVFVTAGLATSRGDARRLAQGGGLSIDDEKITAVDVPFADLIGGKDAVLLRKGKKQFRRVAVTG